MLRALLSRRFLSACCLALLVNPRFSIAEDYAAKLVAAAKARTEQVVRYDGSYRSLDYPDGDVLLNIGVCTDLVIRAYRALDVDLQSAVHEDMRKYFAAYPSSRIWGLSKPDANIDHRRVPNLQAFFTRVGLSLPVSPSAADYVPGDLVTWMLPGNLPHIGIVSDELNRERSRPMIIHNIGAGPQSEDRSFDFPITGHYRYVPPRG